MTEALRPGLRTRAFVFNTLLQDKATKDRLRGYPHWLASRNLANEASDESVEALIEAVQGRYDLARRWYALKARLLGPRPARLLRPHGARCRDSDDRIPYGEAEEIVLDCYRTFSPELGEAAAEFFTGGYIDGPPRPGKRGGAFCSYTVPSRAPVRDAQLHVAPPRRAHDGPRARATACTPRWRARRASSTSPPR